MKGKLLGLIAVTALALGFAATGAQAQSAKFAASYDTDLITVDTGLNTTPDSTLEQWGAAINMAKIHVPSQQDLLIGVSAEIGIFTLTEAKGKNATTSSRAIAEGDTGVTVRLAPEGSDKAEVCADNVPNIVAAPGQVTLAARMQELSVTSSFVDPTDEFTVKLILDTSAAHHFNFLGIDLAQGTYDTIACFDLHALAQLVGDATMAQAKVSLGKRVVAVQEVRAAKGGIIDESTP